MSYTVLSITVLLLFLSIISGACAFSRHYGPLPPPVFLPPLPPPPPRLQPIHAIADLANAIGNTLLKDLSQEGCNSAVSPFGAITALLLLWEGSGGPSFSQVDHALGLDVRNWDRSAIRIGYRDLHRHLRGYLSKKNFLSGIKLSNPRTRIKSEYLDILRFYGYNLEVLGVDNITTMGKPEKRPTTEPTTIYTTKENTPKIPDDTNIPTSPSTSKETTTNWILVETTTKQVTMITPAEEDNKSTTETIVPQDQTTEPVVPQDQTTEPVVPQDQTTEPVVPQDQTTEPVVPQDQTTEPVVPPDQTTEPVVPQDQTTEPAVPQDQTTEPVVPQDQTTEPVVPQDQTTEPVVPQEQTTEPVVPQDQTTASSFETTTTTISPEINGEVTTATQVIPSAEIEPITTESSGSEIVTTLQPEETTIENSNTEIEVPIFTTESSANEDLTTLVTTIQEEIPVSSTSTESTNNQDESTEVVNANSEEISTPDNSMNPENSNNNEQETTNESSMAPSLSTETISETDSTINPTENEIALVDMTSVVIDFSTESPENAETQEITTPEQTNFDSDQIIFRPLRSLPLERGKNWLNRPLSFRNSIDLFENDDLFPFKQWSPVEDKGFFWWQPPERRDDSPRTLLRHFFIPNEKPKLVSMMIYSGNLLYAEYLHALQGASALVLPLDDERYNLLILMPKLNMNVDQLVAILPRFPLRKILNSLTLTRVQSMVPSFRSQGIVDLTPSLNKHGVCDVFNENRANLSRMALEPYLHVHHIEQDVTVMIRHYVDLIDGDSRLHRARGPPELFIADRPFVYYVVDKMTKVALVIGKMENPLDQNLCNN